MKNFFTSLLACLLLTLGSWGCSSTSSCKMKCASDKECLEKCGDKAKECCKDKKACPTEKKVEGAAPAAAADAAPSAVATPAASKAKSKKKK
jgi:hypothetical protein